MALDPAVLDDLKAKVDRAVKGEFPEVTERIGGHRFKLRSLENKNLLAEGETGYFRHRIKARDNRVFFSIDVKGKDKYKAVITRIQYRGLVPGSDTVQFDSDVTGAAGKGELSADLTVVVAEAGKLLAKEFGPKIKKKLKKVARQKQTKAGKFEDEASIIVDLFGRRLARDG